MSRRKKRKYKEKENRYVVWCTMCGICRLFTSKEKRKHEIDHENDPHKTYVMRQRECKDCGYHAMYTEFEWNSHKAGHRELGIEAGHYESVEHEIEGMDPDEARRFTHWCSMCEVYLPFTNEEYSDHDRNHHRDLELSDERKMRHCIICGAESEFTKFEWRTHRMAHRKYPELNDDLDSKVGEMPDEFEGSDELSYADEIDDVKDEKPRYVRVPEDEEEKEKK